MSIRLAISGATGRMGQTLVALSAADDFELVGGIDHESRSAQEAAPFGLPAIETAENATEIVRAADVVLDFSAPVGLERLLALRARELRGKALVIGTTGLTSDIQRLLEQAATQTAVLVAANFSVGVNLLLGMVEAAARVLNADHYDVEIVEAHHRRKVDAPSGTALALGEAVARGRAVALDKLRRDGRSGEVGPRQAGQIGFHALRGGEVVGEHRVHFLGVHERIEIAHSAQDRGVFAQGALRAARWIAGKPAGKYSMQEVLGL